MVSILELYLFTNRNSHLILLYWLFASVFERGTVMKTGFIGAGKVGFSLGKYFSEHGIQVTGYFNRHEESAKEAAAFTGTSFFESPDELIEASDAVFLTVPDGEIKNTFDSLPKDSLNGKMIIHCSGALSADEAFPDAMEKNIVPISIHPLYPFADKYKSYEGLEGVFFCLEGSSQERNAADAQAQGKFVPGKTVHDALAAWSELLQNAGLRTKILSPGRKAEYHLACVEMSNMICGLASLSKKHMENAGFTSDEALLALQPLFMKNASNIFEKGPAMALSGPVERGDTGTLEKHLKYMYENERNLYLSCAFELIKLAKEKNPDKDYQDIYSFADREINNIK